MSSQRKHQNTRTTDGATNEHRYEELREILEERRRQIVSEVREKISAP